jgi:hypothetical protein
MIELRVGQWHVGEAPPPAGTPMEIARHLLLCVPAQDPDQTAVLLEAEVIERGRKLVRRETELGRWTVHDLLSAGTTRRRRRPTPGQVASRSPV